MSAETRLVVEPLDVRARLRELDLIETDLTESLLTGASGMALCTSNHPPIYAGLTFWAEAVRTLRDRKMADGWQRSDARNYSTVINADRTLQIAIARGDEWTGRHDVPDGKPSTQHKKGTATQLAVEINQQLSLFDEVPAVLDEVPDAATTTWVLLHYLHAHKIRCELSRPTAINSSGFVEAWGERIILGTIDLDPTRITLPDDAPVAPDVLVRRRA